MPSFSPTHSSSSSHRQTLNGDDQSSLDGYNNYEDSSSSVSSSSVSRRCRKDQHYRLKSKKYNNKAADSIQLGQYEKAIQSLEKAMACAQKQSDGGLTEKACRCNECSVVFMNDRYTTNNIDLLSSNHRHMNTCIGRMSRRISKPKLKKLIPDGLSSTTTTTDINASWSIEDEYCDDDYDFCNTFHEKENRPNNEEPSGTYTNKFLYHYSEDNGSISVAYSNNGNDYIGCMNRRISQPKMMKIPINESKCNTDGRKSTSWKIEYEYYDDNNYVPSTSSDPDNTDFLLNQKEEEDFITATYSTNSAKINTDNECISRINHRVSQPSLKINATLPSSSNDGIYYQRPIWINRENGHAKGLVIFVVITFNLALAYHLAGVVATSLSVNNIDDDENDRNKTFSTDIKNIKKALLLYEMASQYELRLRHGSSAGDGQRDFAWDRHMSLRFNKILLENVSGMKSRYAFLKKYRKGTLCKLLFSLTRSIQEQETKQ